MPLHAMKALRVTLLLGLSACGAKGEIEGTHERVLHIQRASKEDSSSLHYDHHLYFGSLTGTKPARISKIQISPPKPKSGERFEVSWDSEGLSNQELALGVLPSRAAARQEVAHGQPGQPEDERSIWKTLVVQDDGHHSLEFELPKDWQSQSATLVAELRTPGGAVIPVTEGPRSRLGQSEARHLGQRGFLALLSIQTLPVEIIACRLDADEKIKLDGVLDERCWSRPGQRLFGSLDGEPDERLPKSRVWMAWDQQALYVAGRLWDKDIFSTYKEQDDPLYQQEAFEVFVSANADGNHYLEYQVSPRNVHFDAFFPRYRKGEVDWNSAMTSAVAVDGTLDNRRDQDQQWRVELRIPWSEIVEKTGWDEALVVGSKLRGNVFRVDRRGKKDREMLAQSLSPTRKPDFHAWENAAVIVLGDSKANRGKR